MRVYTVCTLVTTSHGFSSRIRFLLQHFRKIHIECLEIIMIYLLSFLIKLYIIKFVELMLWNNNYTDAIVLLNDRH